MLWTIAVVLTVLWLLGLGEQLHDGRFYSHPAGDCRCRGPASDHPGPASECKEMNAGQARWSRRYQAALRQHLKQGPASRLQPALRLGRQAAALGLETLDVARIHEGALAALEPSSGREGMLQAGGDFFCRDHHADRRNTSRRAQGEPARQKSDRGAGAANRRPGNRPAAVENRGRPAEKRRESPQEKRGTLRQAAPGIPRLAGSFAAPGPPDSLGPGAGKSQGQPRTAR